MTCFFAGKHGGLELTGRLSAKGATVTDYRAQTSCICLRHGIRHEVTLVESQESTQQDPDEQLE
jgi:hypothetical protein